MSLTRLFTSWTRRPEPTAKLHADHLGTLTLPSMLRKALSQPSLACAISAFTDGHHRAAKEMLEATVRASRPNSGGESRSPEMMMAQRLSANLSGVLAHYHGDHERAASDLALALQACTAQGRSGQGHDSYVDLSGVLIDLAVNDIARGQTASAEVHLKYASSFHALARAAVAWPPSPSRRVLSLCRALTRPLPVPATCPSLSKRRRARYMAIRAYRPDARVVSMCESARAELALLGGDKLAALGYSIDASAQQPGPPSISAHQAAAMALNSKQKEPAAAAVAAAAAAAVQRANSASELRVRATAACVRSRCLRVNGLTDEALELAGSSLKHFETVAPTLSLSSDARPLPLLHARLLVSDALAHFATSGPTIDVRLGLEHARLLLAAELGPSARDVAITENNLRLLARDGPSSSATAAPSAASKAELLRDLPMLPPGLGLADSDPFKLEWRPVGLASRGPSQTSL